MAENKQTKHEHYSECIPEEAVEHAKTAREEMRKSIQAILPPEFLAHRRKARLEMLMAAREFINHTIEKLETQEKE
jgi:hypothetical protein